MVLGVEGLGMAECWGLEFKALRLSGIRGLELRVLDL